MLYCYKSESRVSLYGQCKVVSMHWCGTGGYRRDLVCDPRLQETSACTRSSNYYYHSYHTDAVLSLHREVIHQY